MKKSSPPTKETGPPVYSKHRNDYASDLTFVEEFTLAKNELLDTRYKKKRKNYNNTVEENIWSTQNGYDISQSTSLESESLLKIGKGKHIKFGENSKEDFNCQQSYSFLNDNMSKQVFTDDSEIIGSDQRKKKKIKAEIITDSADKTKKRHFHELLSQDIFKQNSSEEPFNASTPKKMKRNKYNGDAQLCSELKKTSNNGDHFKNEPEDIDMIQINSSSHNINRSLGNMETSLKTKKKTKHKGLSSSYSNETSFSFNGEQKKKSKKEITDLRFTDSSQYESGDSQTIKSLNSHSLHHSISLDDSKIEEGNNHHYSSKNEYEGNTSLDITGTSLKRKKKINDYRIKIEDNDHSLRQEDTSKNRIEGKHDSLTINSNDIENNLADSDDSIVRKNIDPQQSANLQLSTFKEVKRKKKNLKIDLNIGNQSIVEQDSTDAPLSSLSFKLGRAKNALKSKPVKFQDIFRDMPAEVNFEVPQLHKILNRASKPTIDQRAKIVLKGLKVKSGKYTRLEDKLIHENWKTFIETYDLEDKPSVFFCLDKQFMPPAFKKVFLYHLARYMPERTPYSVFRRFKILMAQTKRGRFTEEENLIIKKMIEESKNKPISIGEIAEQLERPAVAITKRIRKIESAHTRKIKWQRHNAAAFIRYLLKVTKLREENLRELEDRHITSKEWRKLSQQLDDVPVRILVRAWLEKLHPALFMPCDLYDLRHVKYRLVRMLCDNNETDWRTVNWSHYASQFPGLTYLRVYTLMAQLVKVFVPKAKRNKLKKCLKILKDVPEEKIPEHVMHKIKYKNGKVHEW